MQISICQLNTNLERSMLRTNFNSQNNFIHRYHYHHFTCNPDCPSELQTHRSDLTSDSACPKPNSQVSCPNLLLPPSSPSPPILPVVQGNNLSAWHPPFSSHSHSSHQQVLLALLLKDLLIQHSSHLHPCHDCHHSPRLLQGPPSPWASASALTHRAPVWPPKPLLFTIGSPIAHH